APLTQRYFITNAVYTVPSLPYNCPDQLKHAHNHDLLRVLIEAMNINSLSDTYTPATHTHKVVTNKLSTRYSAGSRYLGHSLVELGVK
ncbi:hypothetical protein ACTXT7_016927, partial [Hymenolepis weldensis]